MTTVFAVLCILALGWFVWGVFERPSIGYEVGGYAEGRRAQQRLFAVVTGKTPGRDGRVSMTLTERELNALIARHVPAQQLPLAEPGIRLIGDGRVELTGRLPWHDVLGDAVGTGVRFLPDPWTATPVWVRLSGQVRLETGTSRTDRRTIRLDPSLVRLGSRRVPAFVLAILPEGRLARATRWTVPNTWESILIESGRVTITARP